MPGCDLLGRAIAPRAPRTARLPQGYNTFVSDDGATLLAACDGEVRLHSLRIDVLPMHVHDGDVGAQTGSVTASGGLFVCGSVRGARITAWGDVYVQGDVEDGRVTSEGGSIAVAGRVNGTEQRRSVLKAAADVTCSGLLHAEIRAGGDIHLLNDARLSVLAAAGSLHLPSIEKSLCDVQLHLGGGLAPAQPAGPRLVTLQADRQHFRITVTHDAFISPHGRPPLHFAPCTIVDLSTSGARCRLACTEPRPGTIVQVKFDLPDGNGQVLVVARTVRWVAPGVIALAFLQMTERDQHRLKMFCVQLLMQRGRPNLPTRADRVVSG